MPQAFVQGAISTNASASITLAYTSNVTAGNTLVALCDVQGPTATCTTMTIADTILNSWTPAWGAIQSPVGGSINKFLLGWFCKNTTSAANTITFTTNATNVGGLVVSQAEFSGLTTPSLDVTAAAAGPISTAMQTLSFTTTRANEIIYVLTVTNGTQSSAPTITLPFLIDQAGTTNAICDAYSIEPTASTYAFNGTWSTAATGNTLLSFGFSLSNLPGPGGGAAWVNRERHFVNKR